MTNVTQRDIEHDYLIELSDLLCDHGVKLEYLPYLMDLITARVAQETMGRDVVLKACEQLIRDYMEVKTMWSGDSYDLLRGQSLEPTLMSRTNQLLSELAALANTAKGDA